MEPIDTGSISFLEQSNGQRRFGSLLQHHPLLRELRALQQTLYLRSSQRFDQSMHMTRITMYLDPLGPGLEERFVRRRCGLLEDVVVQL